MGHETAFFVSTALYAIGWTPGGAYTHRVTRHRGIPRGSFSTWRPALAISTHPLIFALMILTVLHCAQP
jgi:hypothetical protein